MDLRAPENSHQTYLAGKPLNICTRCLWLKQSSIRKLPSPIIGKNENIDLNSSLTGWQQDMAAME